MFDVLIIGAGPAGLSAAIACAEHGLHVKIVDEFMKPGGRLLGQLHQEPSGEWWNGVIEAENLFKKANELGIEVELGTSVYNIERTGDKWTAFTTKEIIEVPRLLIATGAAETAVPIPGWTLPGVMSIGASQVMTNVQRVKVGNRGVIVGVNVLSVAIARELQLAGIEVDRMLLPASNPATGDAGHPEKVMKSLLRVAHLAPSKLIKIGSKLLKAKFMQDLAVQFYPKNGMKMWGMPIQLRKAALEVYGESQVEGVLVADVKPDGTLVKGSEEKVSADFVCIAGSLYPLVELAAVAGCEFRFIPELGGHVPIHNTKMQTNLKGLYVAGNITGIESAKVAMAQGNVAGISISIDAGSKYPGMEGKLHDAIQNVEYVRNNATIQFHPEIQAGRDKVEKYYQESVLAR